MSAVEREIRRACRGCGCVVLYKYDKDGMAVPFDELSSGDQPHVCPTPRDRFVGTRPVQRK